EAHGRGIAIQLNYLLDYGAFTVNRDGTFAVNTAKIKDGVSSLTREFMTLQAEGNYSQAKDMIAKLGVVRSEVKRVLDRLTSIPVDIEPNFVTANSQSPHAIEPNKWEACCARRSCFRRALRMRKEAWH